MSEEAHAEDGKALLQQGGRRHDGSAVGGSKLKAAGGIAGSTKESINRAFSYLLANKTAFGVGREVDTQDFHVEVIDLLGNRVPARSA